MMHGQKNIKLLLLCKVFHQGELCWSRSLDEFLARFQSGEKRLLAPSCLPVRLSARNNSALSGRILMKCVYLIIFRKSVEKIQV